MNIYVLTEGTDYEGKEVLDVATSLEYAKAILDLELGDRSAKGWERQGESPPMVWVRRVGGSNYQEIQRFRVEV